MLLGAVPLQSLEALGDQLVFNAEWIVSRTSPVSLSIAELKKNLLSTDTWSIAILRGRFKGTCSSL